MNSSQQQIKIIGIKTIKHLCFVLNVNKAEIDLIIENIDRFYYKNEKISIDNNGKEKIRILYPSTGRLKEIQSTIKKRMLDKIPLPFNIMGGVKGKDNIQNAKFHQGNKYVFLTDLKGFFPSISNTQVFKMFLEKGFSKEVASILTKLTTYNNELPQGTPTSTNIANLIYLPIDYKLLELCKKYEIKYSRFVDDLTFSSKKHFKYLQDDLIKIIRGKGHKISHKKTKYTSGIAVITGVPVKNNTLGIPEKIKLSLQDKFITQNRRVGRKRYKDRILETNTNVHKSKSNTMELRINVDE